MKKIALLLALVMMLSAFTACGNTNNNETSQPTETQTPTESAPAETTEATDPVETLPEETFPEPNEAENMIAKIYENKAVELMLMTMAVDLTDEFALPTYAGTESAEGIVCGAFSEPMIGSQAYSMSVFQCESAEKAAELAQTMFDNINTRKWICVEASEKKAAVIGDVALFVMIDPLLGEDMGLTIDDLVAAFAAACGVEAPDTIIE